MKIQIAVFATVVIIALQICLIGYAKTDEEELPEEIAVFNRLGILNVDPEIGYNGKETVSRADFADLLAKALNAMPAKNVRYFSDVPQDYWAAGAINSLYERGIISPAQDRRFNPDAPITYGQACKLLVYAAGYIDYAELLGGDINACIQVAEQIDIAVKVANREALIFDEAVALLYRGMSVHIVSFENGEKRIDQEKTLFSVCQQVKVGRGVITAIYGAQLEGYFAVEEECIRIGTDEYKLSPGYMLDTLFGADVQFVYREESDETWVVLYAKAAANRREMFTLDSTLIYSYDTGSRRLQYYSTEERKQLTSINLESGVQIIYNGRPYPGGFSEILDDFISGERRGSLCMVDNGGSSAYDVIIVKSYKIFIAGSYDTNNNILYSNDGAGKQLVLDAYTFVNIIDAYGVSTQIPQTMPVVLSVAESADGGTAEIVICQDKREGMLQQFNYGEKLITIDGEEYTVSSELAEQLRYAGINKTVSVILDQFGTAVFSVQGNDEMQVVYAMYVKEIGWLENGEYTFALTVYQTDKKFHTYYISDNLRIDGIRYKTDMYKRLFDAFPGDTEVTEYDDGTVKINLKRQVMRIRVDGGGRITEIDTYKRETGESSQNTLTRMHDGSTELIYNSHLRRFGLDTLYNSSETILFVVPVVNADGKILINGEIREETEDMYNTAFTFIHDYYYAVESFQYNGENKYTDVIVLKQDPIIEETTVFMFDRIDGAIDAEDEPAKKIVGFANGGIIEFLADRTAESKLIGLKQGDIVRVTMNTAKTAVCDIIKLFDAETMTFNNNGENPYWYAGLGKEESSAWQWNYRNAKYQLIKGYVLENNSGLLKTTYKAVDLPYGIYDEAIDAGGVQYTVYDKNLSEKKRIRVGTWADAVSYRAAGRNCAMVLINLQSGVLKQVFVYR